VVQFRDSAINIGSPADGDLDINADDEIELNSTLIDINGNVDISGTIAAADALTMATNKKIIFRDAAIHISSTADGDLSIAADDEIDITSTLIDVNGNLDVSGTFALGGDLTIAEDSSITIQGTSNEGGGLLNLTGTDTPAADKILGAVRFGNSNDIALSMIRGVSSAADAADLVFLTEATGAAMSEGMRLTSANHLLIGKTDDDNTTTGTAIHDNGFMSISRSANIAMILDRSSNEGEILRLTEAGTERGSLHINGDRMLIDSAGDASGLRFDAASYTPFKNGSAANGTVDLGFSSGRFKDLFLSGGVFLGGTDAAHKLDDYEEGTWTPIFDNVTAPNYTTQLGKYTKIGRFISLICAIQPDNIDTSDNSGVIVTGFPYAGDTSTESVNFTLGRFTSFLGDNANDVENMRFTGLGVMFMKGSNSNITYNSGVNNTLLQFSVTYQTS